MDYLATVRQMEARQARYQEALARVLTGSTAYVGGDLPRVGLRCPAIGPTLPRISPRRSEDS